MVATLEMERCIRRLKKKARYGENYTRMALHQDTINELEKMGFKIENPEIPITPDKRAWKNPIKVTISLDSPKKNTYAERIFKLSEKCRRKSADKVRKANRKLARDLFGVSGEDNCGDCVYRDVCEDFSGKRCSGYIEEFDE